MSYRIVYFTHSLSILLKLIEVHQVSAAAQIVIPSPTPTADNVEEKEWTRLVVGRA